MAGAQKRAGVGLPKQFIRGEWFVGTALLTGIDRIVC
jgi:hypothetical protein